MRRTVTSWLVGVACAAALVLPGCGKSAAPEVGVATPALTVSPERAPLGSPVEMKFTFQVATDAPKFDTDYRVFVHVMDQDGERLWIDDHDLPIPTTTWTAGQTVEYTRTSFVPVVPYNGLASVQIGLYAPKDGTRLPLTGEAVGQRAYRVAKLDLAPQSENVFLLFKDGWQPSEISESDPTLEWQWTKRAATWVFANPRKDALFYLHYDGRPDLFSAPQDVTLSIGDRSIDRFTVASPKPAVRKVLIPAAAMGDGEKVELRVDAGTVFIPSQLPGASSTDGRELGLRVYHAYLRPQ
ncbi:MAG: hypothetical protein U0Q12_00115 [Vicinamibacterales bacterium]